MTKLADAASNLESKIKDRKRLKSSEEQRAQYCIHEIIWPALKAISVELERSTEIESWTEYRINGQASLMLWVRFLWDRPEVHKLTISPYEGKIYFDPNGRNTDGYLREAADDRIVREIVADWINMLPLPN